ncbi:MAG TPA: helix-turn-helix transcriptional regulator [Thermoleophilaceae bacterium]|nr:helix-turn-helix transcriptional regulator [Thermoleophilaceae bacterium]
MATGLRAADTTLEAIERLTDSGLTAQELLEEAAQRIDRVVPSDGYFLGATDPQTTLAIGAGVVRDLPHDLCQPTWDYEFMVPDYLKFTDIADSGRPVADLHEATGGRPERSPRWREYSSASGFRAEVRTTFTLGKATWGIGQFDRLGDSPRFSDDEKAWLERVAPLVAMGLRRALLAETATAPADRGPGLVLLDEDWSVVSATREAADWLGEVDGGIKYDSGAGFALPFEAHAYAAQVRAAAESDRAMATARARVRTRSGVWLLMHASLLEGTDQLALIIEPAKAADVAPLIVEAYGFSQRELEVTRLIARGHGTSEIAATLFISPHTVRDHVKAVFEKVGVSSRGELVAKVFADHYAPVPHDEPATG